MRDWIHYTYSVLRYRHDAMSGETLNVGVVLFSAVNRELQTRFSTKYGRLKTVFPQLDGEAFRSTLRIIEKGLESLGPLGPRFMLGSGDVRTLVETVLKQDESAFHWSEMHEGVTHDLQDEADYLFRRFVTWSQEASPGRRTDSDVWKPVKQALRARQIDVKLEAKEIRSNLTDVKFDHAWKNGKWHVFQPLSLDLQKEDRIQKKVAEWSGYLVHLQEASEDFQSYFILGKPQKSELLETYNDMAEALRRSPGNPLVYTDEQTDDLADVIEDQVKAHRASQHPLES